MHTDKADHSDEPEVIRLAPEHLQKPAGRTEELLRLILALSTNFIILPADEIDEGIRDVLRAVGDFASVDRCYVFQFSENGGRISNTHEWCAHGLAPLMNAHRFMTRHELPWFFERVSRLGAIHIPDVDLLPPQAWTEKTRLLGKDVKSLLFVPMVCGDMPIGFLGLDSIGQKKAWDEEITSLLKIVGEIFVNALARKRGAEALAASEEKYRNIFENAIEGIFQSTPGGRFLSVNPAMARMYGYDSSEEMIDNVTDIAKQVYVHREQCEEFKRTIERDGRVEGIVLQQCGRDGRMFWTSMNARAVRDGMGIYSITKGPWMTSPPEETRKNSSQGKGKPSEASFRKPLTVSPFWMAREPAFM